MNREPIWVRKRKAEAMAAQNAVNLVGAFWPGGCMLYAERYPGVCVTAEDERSAGERLHGELNAYRSWYERRAVSELYTPVVRERHTVRDCKEAVALLFDCERKQFPAKTHSMMRDAAVRSALSFTELYNSLPDPDLPLGGTTGRERLKALNACNELFSARLGFAYSVSGDLYADRQLAIKAMEQPGYMKNAVFERDGESWSYRKVLRRMIRNDWESARLLYACAVAVWREGIADPFGFDEKI